MERLKKHLKKYPLKLIIFDLDGTLVDSIHDIYAALQACCQHYKIPAIPKTAIREFVGPGAEELIKTTIKDTPISLNDFYATFRDLYRRDFISQTHLFPGIQSLLDNLKNHYKLAILTNKPEDASCYLLQNLNIDHLFTKIAGPDTYNIAKPEPGGLLKLIEELNEQPNNSLFIGDTITDIHSAQAANVPHIAITHGYGCSNSITDAKPDAIMNSVSQLEEFLRVHYNSTQKTN
ncbi:MAG: HAD-IA family hydrolase [bacterium]